MNEYQHLRHPHWECKYHVVFIPKYRRKMLFEAIRKELDAVFRTLAHQQLPDALCRTVRVMRQEPDLESLELYPSHPGA